MVRKVGAYPSAELALIGDEIHDPRRSFASLRMTKGKWLGMTKWKRFRMIVRGMGK